MPKTKPAAAGIAAAEIKRRIALAIKNTRGDDAWLHLSGLGLTELPEEVFRGTNIQNLVLSGNELTTVPSRLWDVLNIKTIVLIDNPIESLPNLPGLVIDGGAWRRCHHHIDAKNVVLNLSNETSDLDADLVITQSKLERNPPNLLVGYWGIGIGQQNPKPKPPIQKILASLAGFRNLETETASI